MRRAFDAIELSPFEAMNPEVWTDADVAIIDHRMPLYDGCDVAKVAREANPTIRLIMYTAYEGGITEECIELFDLILLKPVTLNKLRDVIEGTDGS